MHKTRRSILTDQHEIRPFRIEIPDEALDDLRGRLERARLPVQPEGAGWERGVPRDYLAGLLEYWKDGYDWRAQEAAINAVPQFETTLDGARVHFFHVRSPEPNALPLLLVHGWPDSNLEFLDVIGPLTDPARYGGDPADAFHVVVPSLPGFGFSGPTVDPGWGLERFARVLAALMGRLGYGRYAVQGGDVAAFIAPILALLDPERVVGVHVNALFALPSGDPAELEELTDDDRGRLERMEAWEREYAGYRAIQTTRPQTLAHGLTDSPAGQLAWIVDHLKVQTNPAIELPDDAIDRDRILTGVMAYWLTGTAGSSAHFYWDYYHAGDPATTLVFGAAPMGVAVFPGDVTVRRFAERAFDVVRWSEFERGGHYPALEAPDLLVGDVRAFLRKLR